MDTLREITIASLAALTLPSGVAAQSALLELEGSGAALEFRHPSFEDGALKPLAGTYYLLGHHALCGGDQVVLEVPWTTIAFADGDPYFGAERLSAFGNVYVAWMRQARGGSSGFDAGVRLPTADEDMSNAGLFGFVTSIVDRVGAYSPETVSFVGGVSGSTAPSEHTDLRGRVGMTLLHYTGDSDVDDQAIARFTLQSLTALGGLRFGGGVDAMFVMTGSGGNVGERSLIEVALQGGWDFGPVTAGVQLHLPVDEDYEELIDRVIGFSIEASLPSSAAAGRR